jgi:oligopeptidase B
MAFIPLSSFRKGLVPAFAGVLSALILAGCQSPAKRAGSGRVSQENNVTTAKTIPAPPVAKKVPHVFREHGNERIDNYQWLRDDSRSDPEVLAYLNAENDYYAANMATTGDLRERLYQEIVSRISQEDQSVPYRLGDYFYYRRYNTGQEYPVYARKRGSLDAPEEILVDMNERASGHSYFQSNNQSISHDHNILAFSEDTVGRRQYNIRFKDLQSGKLLPDVIENTTGALEWAKDNQTVFYVRKHPVTLLPYRVYRHKLGTPPEQDKLVYEEKDNTFYTALGSTRSRDFITIESGSTTQSEVRLLDANDPEGEFTVFLPREKDHEYSIEQLGDDFYVLTNWQAKNFRVMKTDLAHAADKSSWQEVIPHSDDVLVYDIAANDDFLAIEQRKNGIRQISLLDWKSGQRRELPSDENAYTMHIGYNPDQHSNVLRFHYSSLTTPDTVYDYNVATGEKTLKKRDKVLGEFSPQDYVAHRLYVKVRDGELVPVSLVFKKGPKPLKERPLLVYGYGSYGHSVDPAFSSARLSLLDRDFVYAIAHIRGSQAKGRRWYEDGKLLKKKNTFNDFVDVTKGLVRGGLGDPERVYAWGGSAGGLLMGAVVNQAPELYHGVIADVPFVDVVTTMLDEDIPLTTGEFDEWGDPKKKVYYDYMLSYSPYDQVSAQDYPNMLVTTGLHDSQVQYWEPAKWVAKLRDMKTDNNLLMLRTNMHAGHGGASGRFQHYKETADDYAFLLKLATGKEPRPNE